MSDTRAFHIRHAHTGDAAEIAALANALNVHEGKPSAVHSEASIRRDVLGGDCDFTVLVAECGGRLVGYTIHHPTYNSDLGVRGMWGVDLYVAPVMRGRGVARALTAAMAAHALSRGFRSLWWNVRAANARARAAYRAMGAREDASREVQLQGEALHAIAGEAEAYGFVARQDLRWAG
jgi:GNAT superfamily N-acetyltransferase